MQKLAKLRHSGLRITKSRKAILDLLQQAHVPITRRELCHRGAEKGVYGSAVYRTLPLLVAEGLVDVSENSAHDPCFELACERHHHHLQCERCGKTNDVRCHVPESTLRKWERDYQFRITSHSGDIFGLCAKCARLTPKKS